MTNPAKKRSIFKLSLALVSLIFLAAVGLGVHTWYFKPLRLNWFYERTFFQQLLSSPQILSSLRLFDSLGIAWYNDQLDDYSLAQEERDWQKLVENEKTFRSYDASKLTGVDRVTWLIADYQYQHQIAQHPWQHYQLVVSQQFGLQSEIPNFMITTHALLSRQDARDYITRLKKFPAAFDQILEQLKVRESEGIDPPGFMVDAVVTQLKDWIATPPKETAISKVFSEKIQGIKELSDEERQNLNNAVLAAVEQQVIPSYQKLLPVMEKLQQKKLSSDGVWRLPKGEAYYNHLIQHHTTTHMTADEIHELGLKEVARIGREMDQILAAEQIPGNSRMEKIKAVAARPDQHYENGDAAREQILKDYQAIIQEVQSRLPSVIGLTSKSGIEVRRVPAESEKGAPGAYYYFPALDGSRPGVFYANLREPASLQKFGMRTLAYHEAVPGHHTQIALQLEMQDLPNFRKATDFTAYIEGWALYAEHLAWELGLHPTPFDVLGKLQAEMFRAVRLVVDTGLHAKRWTREQAVDYMLRETGMPRNEVTAEIDRYLVYPGQALAYKIGMMKILALREQAKQALGSEFDLKAFHDLVLGNGAVPLDVLDKLVNDWIAQRRPRMALAGQS